jgi:subtilisin-like proprotein convertase family protein
VNGLTRTFVVNSTTPMEEIRVALSITINNANHIGAILTSPRGTSAVLFFPGLVDTNGQGVPYVPQNINWTFTSNAYWGEIPQGTWTLRVLDGRAGVTGTWNAFSAEVRMGQLQGRAFYVDKAFTGVELGTQQNPFRTVTAALTAVGANEGARIYIKAGNYGSDRPRVTKRVQFVNWGNTGQARIGQP